MAERTETPGISMACSRLEVAMYNFDASGSDHDYDEAVAALKEVDRLIDSIPFADEKPES